MAYVDLSAHFTYKKLLTYQDMNQLGANDEALRIGSAGIRYQNASGTESVSTSWITLCSLSDITITQFLQYQLKVVTAAAPANLRIELLRDAEVIYTFDIPAPTTHKYDAVLLLTEDIGTFDFTLRAVGLWSSGSAVESGEFTLIYR